MVAAGPSPAEARAVTRPDLRVTGFTFIPVGGLNRETTRLRLGTTNVGVRSIAGLASGESQNVSYIVERDDVGVGIHNLVGCADSRGAVTESNETNNCSMPVRLALIPRFWEADQLEATTGSGGIVTETTGPLIDFEYWRLQPGSTLPFAYRAYGTVAQTVSGSLFGCTHSGSGQVTRNPFVGSSLALGRQVRSHAFLIPSTGRHATTIQSQ